MQPRTYYSRWLLPDLNVSCPLQPSVFFQIRFNIILSLSHRQVESCLQGRTVSAARADGGQGCCCCVIADTAHKSLLCVLAV